MADIAHPEQGLRLKGALSRLIARPGFQAWAARFPLTRGLVRRDGVAIFRLVQGFVESQALAALIELDILGRLADGPLPVSTLARACDLSPDRMRILLQAGAAMGLLKRRRDDRFALSRRGAAMLGVPGLRQMIRHHGVFYSDMADPVALLRGEVETRLAAFWPYVFGAAGAVDPEVTATYSELMSQSQAPVAADTLDTVSLSGVRHLMDVGGGTGAFIAAAAARYPDLRLTLFDLPVLQSAARARFSRAGFDARAAFHPGSFRDDPLPVGADAISLVRVLYDHDDATVTALLRAAFAALPSGGRLIISEPMSGGDRPDAVTDVYFAFYTMAMGTGCTRSAARISDLCRQVGFAQVKALPPRRSFVTSVVSAVKPA